MSRRRFSREAVADWATVSMALCAIVVTAVVVQQQPRAPSRQTFPNFEDREVEDWDEYLSGGHRIGPDNAAVTIVEFGDYECPFCRRLEPALRALLAEYSEEVAIVYRHVPLTYHEHAYQAARLAECAAVQDRFPEAHTRLYDVELEDFDPADFGAAIGVHDLVSCNSEL